jgi:outer membrane receptor protein involved in Fe transport
MAFLFATPPNFGPMSGKLLGGLRTNLVYRIYTGTPYDGPVSGGLAETSLQIVRRVYGPVHTRVDLNLEKQFGSPEGLHTTLGIQVYNLFNQKDLRAVTPDQDRDIDLETDRWQLWGMPGLDPISARAQGTDEIFDLNNYWDRPRELTLSVRLKW